MTKDNLVTAPENTTLEAAERILTENKVEKLLLVDEQYRLKGLITIKDIDKLTNFPNACKDRRGRLRVGAAVGVHDYERAESLIRAGVDVLVVDSAHGHSGNVIDTVAELKRRFDIDVIAGNVATAVGGRVPYKGPSAPFVYQLVGGLRAGMGYCGTRNIEELRTRGRFILVSGASVQESHPHDIAITQEAPNYSTRAEYPGNDGG